MTNQATTAGNPTESTPILKSTETRALFPVLEKKTSIRRRNSRSRLSLYFSSHSSHSPALEFACLLFGIFVIVGLNMYDFDLHEHRSTGTWMHRNLRATAAFTGTDSAWLQQTMSSMSNKHSTHVLRKLQEDDAAAQEVGDELSMNTDNP